ncbi:unnamed protein product [Paramecium sonneborni]|uniref:Anaphase-promoting complex subunit 4-like WD40 domain-containing protein n=1 Tax=Paramecium sonneborni TaxID=65129 RepID=A0A8S1RE70_9CILI|nr:unnamed protein product [Paramecium sonneborni]
MRILQIIKKCIQTILFRVICYNKNSYSCPQYNFTLRKLIRKLKLKNLPLIMQIIDKNKLMVGISNGDAQIFDLTTIKLIKILVGHAYQILQMIPFADQYLITLCHNKEARIWNSRNFQLLFKVNHQIAVKNIFFSKDGQKVILIAYDGSIKVYKTQTGEFINQINHNQQQVYYCNFFQPIDQCLIGYSNKQENTILIWDITDQTNKVIFQRLQKRIKNAYFNSKNFDLVLVFTNSSQIIIYNLLTQAIKAEILGLQNQIVFLDFTKNNHLIICDSNNIVVYSDTGKFKQQLNTFIDIQIRYLKILANLNHVVNTKNEQNNIQNITQDEQINKSEIWLQTPSYFSAIR